MNYLVLARKYRPQLFNEIIGQETIAQALQNAITSNKIGHAYLFAGPRGVGKTTAARIFAKALNCAKGPSAEPDNKCQLCREITEGNALDVLEIDGASNRGIDAIKALRENVKFAPAYARYKIYIIDEVHQLSNDGFNALLKTLEEPPAHIIFIFATTEPQEIPETILSRCQRFNFKLIPAAAIEKQLNTIAAKEKIEITLEALNIISQAAQGSMRDAQSILDQVISFVGQGQKIDGKTVRSILGLTSQELLLKFSQYILGQKPQETLDLIKETQNTGIDLYQLSKDLHLHFRNLLMAKISAQPQELIKLSAESIQSLIVQAKPVTEEALLHYLELLGALENEMKYTDQPRIVLEIGLVKLTRPYIAIDELISRLESLEQGKSGTGQPGKQLKPQVSDRQAPPENDIREGQSAGENLPLRQQWGIILEEIHKKKPGLAGCLANARPKALTGNMLTLEFEPQAKFQKQSLEQAENIKLVEEIAGRIFQLPIKVASTIGTVSASPMAAAAEEGVEIEEEPEETEINGVAELETAPGINVLEQDPVVQKVLDIFEGEIINNRNLEKGSK